MGAFIVGQVERLQRAGSPFSGKSYVNEFGIGAVEMAVQAEAVLSPWYSTDKRSKGTYSCACLFWPNAFSGHGLSHRQRTSCRLLHATACSASSGNAAVLLG